MNYLRFISIKTRLITIFFLSVMVIIFVAIIFFFTSTQLVLEKSKEYSYSTAYNVKNNFNTYLNSCIDNINILTTDVSFIRGVMGFNRALETGDWSSYSDLQYELYKTANKIPGIIGIEVAGITTSIAHNIRPLTTGSIDSSHILKTIMSSEERIHTFGYMELESRPYISNKERHAVVVGAQIKSYINGEVIGAIIFAISDYFLSKDIYIWENKINSDLLVLAPNDTIIATTSKVLAESVELKTINSEGSFSGLRSFHDREYLISQLYTDPLDWRILLITDFDNFSLPLLAQFKKVSFLTVILLSFLFIAVHLVIKSINNPIKQLLKVMKETSTKNRFPIVEVSGSDELSYLGNTFNDMSLRIQFLIKKIKTVTNKKRSAELLALYSQINPHLLYNTLDSINWVAFTNGENEICEIIAALSDFYRLTLNKGKSYHTLSSEIEQIKKYFKLQEVNYQNRFEYSIDINKDLLKCLVPKIILQPIVENSFVHGFSEPKLYITIKIYKQSETLIIDIADNGPAFEISKDEMQQYIYEKNDNGYGLFNINERIKLFYGNEFGISLLSNKPKGLLVRFLLPTSCHNREIDI